MHESAVRNVRLSRAVSGALESSGVLDPLSRADIPHPSQCTEDNSINSERFSPTASANVSGLDDT